MYNAQGAGGAIVAGYIVVKYCHYCDAIYYKNIILVKS